MASGKKARWQKAQSLAIISNTEGGGRSVWLMVIVVFCLFVEGVLPVMAH